MKILLVWSGIRSKETAEILSKWLPQVIQAVEPFLLSDVEKGVRWRAWISDKLKDLKVAIICLTKENQNEPWVLFETGVLSSSGVHVYPFFLDLESPNVEHPLTQFQHTLPNKQDIWRLMDAINRRLEDANERPLSDWILSRAFENSWSYLKERLQEIQKKEFVTD